MLIIKRRPNVDGRRSDGRQREIGIYSEFDGTLLRDTRVRARRVIPRRLAFDLSFSPKRYLSRKSHSPLASPRRDGGDVPSGRCDRETEISRNFRRHGRRGRA